MSNKTQLQQNNLEYDSLIELLSGKSIGSNIILQEKTITPTTSSQTVEPDDGYDGFKKVTVNAMPTTTQATPSITVGSSGLITATSSQNAGYVTSGTKSATKQLTTQGAKTITPSTSSQTAVASGVYTTSIITIQGDANLVADNIKSGVSIFGVAGSYGGSSDQDMFQARVDATNNCDRLFNYFTGTNVDFIASLDTSRVTTMNYMFNECTNLTTIPQLDTSNVRQMANMFYNCSKLTSVPALNTSNVIDMLSMFYGCRNLTSILMTGMKVKFDISASTKFTREALVTILNNLATVTSTRTLTMGSTNLAKLTNADKAIATNKGWTLA